jgi:ABC-type dipeptide/oligopeptide/nickel transport system permease component
MHLRNVSSAKLGLCSTIFCVMAGVCHGLLAKVGYGDPILSGSFSVVGAIDSFTIGFLIWSFVQRQQVGNAVTVTICVLLVNCACTPLINMRSGPICLHEAPSLSMR